MPFDYTPEPEAQKTSPILRDKVDRYRRMRSVRDAAQARVKELEIELAAVTRDRDRLQRILADHTHGDPL